MLVLSLTLHVALATGIALSYFRSTVSSTVATSEATTPPVLLLRSSETPKLLVKPPAVAQVTAPSATPSRPVPRPLPVQPVAEKTLAAVVPSPALTLEANPNAHVQALPPEAVLSPSPAPNLNHADGVVFVLDISGSMYEPYAGSTRLAFAREALSRRIRALKNGTPFAITLYALRACKSGPLVAASDATRDAAIRFIMHDVDCGGGTNLPAGLAAAEQLCPGALVVITDGDLNISAMNLASQARSILGPEGRCPNLTIVGIAPRPATGAERLLEGLADQQDGTYGVEPMEGATELVSAAATPAKPVSATP